MFVPNLISTSSGSLPKRLLHSVKLVVSLQEAIVFWSWKAAPCQALFCGTEIVRSGIMAVSKGQTEAAASLGLRPNRIMNLIILPQALRIIVPPLISNYLNLTKNSSLAIAVGYMDVRGTLGGITLNQTGRELESMLLLMGFYLCVSLLISSFINYFNRSFQIVVR